MGILLAVLLGVVLVPNSTASWSYHGETGPEYWASHLNFTSCGGAAQSPVDVVTSRVTVDATLGRITFRGYDTPAANLTLLNTGHTLQLSVAGDVSITDGGLAGAYRAYQLHFHWGGTSSNGSEHALDGRHFPAEMHIVHYNTNYTQEAAGSYADGLAVLAVMLAGDGATLHAGLQNILSHVTAVVHKNETDSVESFALESLLPSDRQTFIRYAGSLTTPPCSESVTWTLFPDPIHVSPDQLEAFRRLKETAVNETEVPMIDNFRPLQPINGRNLTSSRTFVTGTTTPPGTGASARVTWSSPVTLLALAAVALVASMTHI